MSDSGIDIRQDTYEVRRNILILLKSIRLTNFKGFRDTGSLRLSPITILVGPNSAGKSSLLEALAMLSQTLQDTRNADTVLEPDGYLTRLGSFPEMINGHDINLNLGISVECTIPEIKMNLFPNLENFISNEIHSVSFESEFAWDRESKQIGLQKVNILLNEDCVPTFKLEITTLQELHSLMNNGKTAEDQLALAVLDDISFNKHNKPIKTRLAKQQFLYHDVDWVKDLGIFKEHEKILVGRIHDDSLLWKIIAQNVSNNLLPMMSTWKHFCNLYKTSPEQARDLLNDAETFRDQDDILPIELVKDIVEYLELWLEKFENYNEAQLKQDWLRYGSFSLFRPFHWIPNYHSIPIDVSWRMLNNIFDGMQTHLFYLHDAYNDSVHWNPEEEIGGSIFPKLWIGDLIRTTMTAASNVLAEKMSYVPPIRIRPGRYINLRELDANDYRRLLIDAIRSDPTGDFLNELNLQLTRLGVPYHLRIKEIDTDHRGDLWKMELIDIQHTNAVTVALDQVGHGISQILPVVVYSMVHHNQVIGIQQPELHLHPKLHAELGTMFSKMIDMPYNNQFIIETHSETLILRLLRLVRIGQLKPDDISVIYVDSTIEGSVALPLRVSDTGEFLDEWPNGFFEEAFDEMFGNDLESI